MADFSEFSDLNEEIEADDWLIPSKEITRRRLIKQTPRFKVYKADWFGDVMVYEPQTFTRTSSNSMTQEQQIEIRQKLSLQLSRLATHENLHELQPTVASPLRFTEDCSYPGFGDRIISFEAGDEVEQPDSAYSSISSTPQYHTKSAIKSEFEFPSYCGEIRTPWTVGSDSGIRSEVNQQTGERQSETIAATCTTTEGRAPVALNRESYCFSPLIARLTKQKRKQRELVVQQTLDQSPGQQETEATISLEALSDGVHNDCEDVDEWGSSCWSELNELRLVAHEGFMLFMGVSLDSLHGDQLMGEASEETHRASLVMEMSRSRSSSLFELLHQPDNVYNFQANQKRFNRLLSGATSSSRPISAKHNLDLDSKLNICQQVINAMAYLHDKNIVHGRLTSANIRLERVNQRVKINLIDSDEVPLASASQTGDGQPVACFNLPALTYLSPELSRTISLFQVPTTNQTRLPQQCDNDQTVSGSSHVYIDTNNHLTKMSDIFSFGTVLFELFEERLPFSDKSLTKPATTDEKLSLRAQSNTPSSPVDTLDFRAPLSISSQGISNVPWRANIKFSAPQLIYLIGAGQIETRNSYLSNYPNWIRTLISKCWSTNPLDRPTFKQMNQIKTTQ